MENKKKEGQRPSKSVSLKSVLQEVKTFLDILNHPIVITILTFLLRIIKGL